LEECVYRSAQGAVFHRAPGRWDDRIAPKLAGRAGRWYDKCSI